MAVKLDMSKAYNRVEWSYIEAILKALGFKDQWVQFMMSCITTVSYYVLVNGKPSETFLPSRGMRPTDPLSPYLFLMYAKGFSSLINDSERKGEIHGISIPRGVLSINHFLFADDSIVICHALTEEWNRVANLPSCQQTKIFYFL